MPLDIFQVCSLHFVEGKPTSRSFFPTLYLQPDISVSKLFLNYFIQCVEAFVIKIIVV